jgi:hypothetical protein
MPPRVGDELIIVGVMGGTLALGEPVAAGGAPERLSVQERAHRRAASSDSL